MLESGVYLKAFRYPVPGHIERLSDAISILPAGKHKTTLSQFVKRVEKIGLGAWEELYTRTWDLNPPAAPYIGYQAWGDHYRRGEFMARLRKEYRAVGVPQEGEMPDHLVLILSYLSIAAWPLEELIEILPEAFRKIYVSLSKADKSNPYLILIDALRQED
ncbi:MAG: nitrate reductase, partial [Chloroflexi bacterium]